MQNYNLMNSERLRGEQNREAATVLQVLKELFKHRDQMSAVKLQRRFNRLINQIWPFDLNQYQFRQTGTHVE